MLGMAQSEAAPIPANAPVVWSTWDVDLDGKTEFVLDSFGYLPYGGSHSFNRLTYTCFRAPGALDSVVANNDGIVNLPLGFRIGPTLVSHGFHPANLATNHLGGGPSVIDPIFVRGASLKWTTVPSFQVTHSSVWSGLGSGANEFQPDGLGYIGFQFSKAASSDLYYGWAKVQLISQYGTVSILEAYYEDIPNRSIRVGDTGAAVSETTSTMGLLALGAAGLAAYRRRCGTHAVAE